MAYPQEIKDAVRRSYVIERLTLEEASDKHGVSYHTVRSWKKKAREQGDNWDMARQATRLSQGGIGDLTNQVMEDFAHLFQRVVQDVKSADVEPLKKAEALARLSDSYTKTMRAATRGNPDVGKLAVALEVLDRLAKYVAKEFPEHANVLLDILEPFGDHLAKTYGD